MTPDEKIDTPLHDVDAEKMATLLHDADAEKIATPLHDVDGAAEESSESFSELLAEF